MGKRQHKNKGYSFWEKLCYYKRRVRESDYKEKPFGNGYMYGAETYMDYDKLDDKQKKAAKKDFAEWNERAKRGDEFAKGVMCAARDAAKERKNHKY